MFANVILTLILKFWISQIVSFFLKNLIIGSLKLNIFLQCLIYELRYRCLNFVTLAEPYLATGRGLWEATPLDLLTQTNQVCGRIYFFKLSYFDCSDHFHGREIGWSTVCAKSKLKEAKKPLLKLACICSIWKVHSNLQRVTGPSVV